MIRIALVYDHPVVRVGLRALIEGQDDLAVVGAADGLEAALAVVRRDRPDVVLMDLSLGTGAPGGAEVTTAVRGLDDAPEVLVLTTYDTGSGMLRALDAGARGYLLKDAPPDQLFVSEATVKSHLSHVYTKLGVDTRAGAVAAALERRIIRR